MLAESGAIVDYLVTRPGRGRLAPSHSDPAWGRCAGTQHVLPYLDRMTAREAYQRAQRKVAQ